MDTLDWKIICDLYKVQNISQTAERLYLTQPTVSKRIQLIEKKLGIQLLVRQPKGVAFTSSGECIAQAAKDILQRMEDMSQALRQLESGTAGLIKLGMTNAYIRFLLPSLLHKYTQLNPGVRFDISTGVSSDMVKLLENETVQIAFVRGEYEGPFQRHLISVDHACLANLTPVTLQQLPNLSQISYLSDPYAQNLVKGWWRQHFSEDPKPTVQANHGDTCREMVANGLGFAIFLSPRFVKEDSGLFSMPLYYPDGRPLIRKSWMMWKDNTAKNPLLRNFVNFISAELGDLPAE